MAASGRDPVPLHAFSLEDVEQHREQIIEQHTYLIGRLATREPRLVDLRRFQELFNYFLYSVEIAEYGRVAGTDRAAELEFVARSAEYISIYLAHASSETGIEPIDIEVNGTTVEVTPTKLSDTAFRIFEAPFVITLSRNVEALERWRQFDIDEIFFPNRVGFTYRRHFLACFRSFVLDGVLDRVAIDEMDAVASSAEEVFAENKPDFSQFIYMFQPLTSALIALDSDDAAGFRSAIHDAVIRHQEYWGLDQQIERGGPPIRQDPRGWLSLPATAIAALGHDRGIDLDFESDYLPTHFVNGTA